MTDDPTDRQAINDELARTAYQKKAVSRVSPDQVLTFAIDFFKERGYRAGKAARPNQIFIMGGAEGVLPRVTGEVSARPNIGKSGTTLVTLDAAGERLGPTMAEFQKALRALGRGEQRPG